MTWPTDPQVLEDTGNLIQYLRAQSKAQDDAEPHLLLETEPESGFKQCLGPYENRQAAEAAIPALMAYWTEHLGEPLPSYEPVLFARVEP